MITQQLSGTLISPQKEVNHKTVLLLSVAEDVTLHNQTCGADHFTITTQLCTALFMDINGQRCYLKLECVCGLYHATKQTCFPKF